MRRIHRVLAGGGVGLALLVQTGLATPAPPPSLEGYLQERVAHARLPGASLAVVEKDGAIRTIVTGLADLKERRPVTPSTVYAIGSVTKSFTATAILQLRDRGLLNLDSPVQRYIPWFRLADAETSQSITLRHLLSHTSGIPTSAHGVVWRDPERIRHSLTEGVQALSKVHPAHPPGARFTYSNMNYAVLGLVVEQVSGLSYPDYMRQKVFQPLGMRQSAASVPELPDLDVATPYGPSFGRLAEMDLSSGTYHGPSYLLFASAPDLARYAAAHMAPGRILSAPSLDEAHRGAVATGPGTTYGFGWVREEIAGETVIWHDGGSGHSAFVALMPERQEAVVLLTGAYSPESTTEIGKGLLHILLGQEPPAPRHPRNTAMLLDLLLLILLLPGLALLAVWAWVVWRRRPTRLSIRALGLRAALLTLVAGVSWGLALFVPGHFGLPAPFGWFGYPPDLALTLATWLLASTLWALWAAESFFHHRRLLQKRHRRPGAL